MSLQVSNQGTGRRTPLVYQSFGSNVPAGAATPGGAGTNGAGGSVAANPVGRPPKGGAAGKQSQIPVAVSGGLANEQATQSPGLPPTAVVHPGSGGHNTLLGGVSVDVPSLAFAAQKQQVLQQQQQQQQQLLQFDHQYGMFKQQQPAETVSKASNGNSNGAGGVPPLGGGGSVVVEKNGAAAAKKVDPPTEKPGATNSNASVVVAEGGKVREGPRSSGRTQQKVSEEAQKTPEKPKEKQSGTIKAPPKAPVGESSLLVEKSLKGFDVDGEEMESLLLEPWEFEDSPLPSQGAMTKSKLPKPGPTAHARVAPYKSAGKQEGGEGLLRNFQEPKTPAAEKPVSKTAETPGTPLNESDIGRPLRTISGRRSTRPINDIKFTHHRKSGGLNESISSLNVTVGSDVYMDSLRTPGSATRKRKDMTPESTSEPVESPKRARLDFSGLLGIVASPVTMLKNRLSRVKLHSSTPRAIDVDEEDASKVVTAEATTTTTALDNASKTATASQMEVGEKNVDATAEVKDEKKDTAATESVGKEDDATTAQQSSSAAAVVADSEEEVEVKIVTDKPKQWCSVM